MPLLYSMDGKLVPDQEASVSIHDLGIQRGYGVFDFMPVRYSIPLFLEDYTTRFENSARLIGLELPATQNELKERVLALIQANGRPEAYIRLLLTGGVSEDGYTVEKPSLVIMQHDFEKLKAVVPSRGIKLMTDPYLREVPEAKTTGYLHPIMKRKELEKSGATDLLYHHEGNVLETSRSTFFIFTKKDTIITASKNILPGVTRKHLLKVAAQHFKVEERDLRLEELQDTKEAFICSTRRGVVPVVMIDGDKVGSGEPGENVLQLKKLFEEYVENYYKQAQQASL